MTQFPLRLSTAPTLPPFLPDLWTFLHRHSSLDLAILNLVHLRTPPLPVHRTQMEETFQWTHEISRLHPTRWKSFQKFQTAYDFFFAMWKCGTLCFCLIIYRSVEFNSKVELSSSNVLLYSIFFSFLPASIGWMFFLWIQEEVKVASATYFIQDSGFSNCLINYLFLLFSIPLWLVQ